MTLTVLCQAETEPYQKQGDSDANGDHMGGAPASMFGALVIVLFKHSRETKMVSQFTSQIPNGDFKAQCVITGPGCALYYEINVEEPIGGTRDQKTASHFIVSIKGVFLKKKVS